MTRLESLDGESWEDFLASPAALLVLGRSDCAACGMWVEDLERFRATDESWTHVRFGHLRLDQKGLSAFKRAHPWVAEVCELPTNLLFVGGVKKKTWLGGGTKRLEERLESLRRQGGRG